MGLGFWIDEIEDLENGNEGEGEEGSKCLTNIY